MRNVLQGLWIPRADLLGWQVQFRSADGTPLPGHTYTHDDPGPITQANIEQDANGCLTSGSIALARPRHPLLPAYSFTAHLSLLSRRFGWVEVVEGFIPPSKQGDGEEWTLDLRPLEDLVMGDFFSGVPPAIPGVTSQTHSTLGAEPGEWTETNETVVRRVLERSPTASIGVDANRRVILARPEDGSPAQVSAANFYALKSTGLVTLPYATEARSDPGPGWRKIVYHGIARPPLAERRGIDAGQVEFVEVVRPAGMPVVGKRALTVEPTAEGEEDTPGLPGLTLTSDDLKQPLGAGAMNVRVQGNQYAAVIVLDPQAWYEGSALMAQESDEAREARGEMDAAEAALRLALDTLGPEHPVTRSEGAQLAAAQAQYRLARVRGGSVESDYEPLSALLSLGFDPHDVDAGIITGATMWISRVPWDDAAVGPPPAANPDPDGPLDDGENIEGPAIVHPYASPNTIQVFEAPMTELTSASESKAYQMSQLKIPETYFRGPLGPSLGKLLDKAWRETYDPEEPPEDEEPPSATWDGRWYLHVAAWWQAIAVPQRRIVHDWNEAKTLERKRLAAVTIGPLLRTYGTGGGDT